ncbi:MAG TPA: peptidase M28 family protein, partial [Thermoanaerobaculia bacterium]|nr:peptidase M28 family protein [Thermoanaerobaculia bacterium]
MLAALGLPALDQGPLPSESLRTAIDMRDRVAEGSKAADWVREITDRAGPRLAGSPGDRAAVAVTLEMLKSIGFSNVRAEKVMVPVWSRVSESGEVTAPVSQRLALTALGGSVATPADGLEAELVRVPSFDELEKRRD